VRTAALLDGERDRSRRRSTRTRGRRDLCLAADAAAESGDKMLARSLRTAHAFSYWSLVTLIVCGSGIARAQPIDGDVAEPTQTKVEWQPIEVADPSAGDVYERIAAPTVGGPVGLLHTLTTEVGRAGHFRVSLGAQLLKQDSLIVSSGAGGAGDSDQRFLGDLVVDYTPWKHLELYLAILNSTNQNTRGEVAPARRDPVEILVLGNVAFGVKGRLLVKSWVELGLHVGLKLINSSSSPGIEGDATSFTSDLIASFDLRRAAATAKVPLRFHINVGYFVDNSIHALPDDCATSTSNDACIRSRAVETFAYGVGPSRFRIAAAVDAPLAFGRAWRVGVQPFFEYHADVAVGDGDQTMVHALANDSSIAADRKSGDSQQWLTLGVRVRPISGLALHAGIDLGLSSFGFQYGSPLPPWNVLLGATFDYDAAGVGRTKVVTTTVTRDVARHAVEGRVRGIVRDAQTRTPLKDAVVRYVGRRANAQLTIEDGSFISPTLLPGPITVEASREDYESAHAEVVVVADGEAPVELLLTNKPPADGTLTVKIADEAGALLVAAVHLVGPSGVVDATGAEIGSASAKLPAGEYAMYVVADGYLARQRMVTMSAGQPQAVEVVLHKRPLSSHVTLGRQEIVIKGVIHFGSDNAELKPDAQQLLDEVVDVLAKNPQLRRVRVEGHTDNRGNADRNLELSKARAAAVVVYLVKQGVDPARLESEGYGATEPLVPNLTAANRARNRRVAFRIIEGGSAP
jgi:OmpA-OmpF porin, OOP family